MNTNIIIGICGNARSGKDTFCEYAKDFSQRKKWQQQGLHSQMS